MIIEIYTDGKVKIDGKEIEGEIEKFEIIKKVLVGELKAQEVLRKKIEQEKEVGSASG